VALGQIELIGYRQAQEDSKKKIKEIERLVSVVP